MSASAEQDHQAGRRAAIKAMVAAGTAATVWQAPRVEGFRILPDYAAACTITGTNLVTNGTFAANLTGWTSTVPAGGSVTQTGGEAKLSSANCGAGAVLQQDIAVTPGCRYKLTASIRTTGHYAGYCYSNCIQDASNACSGSNTGLRYLSLMRTTGVLIREWRFNGPIASSTTFTLVIDVGALSAVRIAATQFGGFHCACVCGGVGGNGCQQNGATGDLFLDNVTFVMTADALTTPFSASCPTGGTGC